MVLSTRNILRELATDEQYEITEDGKVLLEGILQNTAVEILEDAYKNSNKNDNVITQEMILKSATKTKED